MDNKPVYVGYVAIDYNERPDFYIQAVSYSEDKVLKALKDFAIENGDNPDWDYVINRGEDGDGKEDDTIYGIWEIKPI